MLEAGTSESLDRQPAVAGSFYSSDAETLRLEIKKFFKTASGEKSIPGVRALISPHAGYIYSGSTAATAYGIIDKETEYQRVFLIGSSHRHRFNGASVWTDGDFLTPLGRAVTDRETGRELLNNSTLFTNYREAHIEEHSLEVQLPFLQYLFNENLRIVPILIGSDSPSECETIARELSQWFTPDNLFIISSDFSHYPPYEDAIELDSNTAEIILKGDPLDFINWIRESEKKKRHGSLTPMCGWTAGLVLLHLAKMSGDLKFKHLSYLNSGDSKAGDKNRVVGYHAIALIDKPAKEFSISREDEEKLLSLARESINSWFSSRKYLSVSEENYSGTLSKCLGAFVTLKKGNKLRGCIGQVKPTEPLYETIRNMSIAAAFNDSRFDPVGRDEFSEIQIEISILSEMRKIEDIKEIVPGKHGIYLKKDMTSATFLPQVASEQKWDRLKLLGHLSRDKAGIGWFGWKEADLYIYEAIIIDE